MMVSTIPRLSSRRVPERCRHAGGARLGAWQRRVARRVVPQVARLPRIPAHERVPDRDRAPDGGPGAPGWARPRRASWRIQFERTLDHFHVFARLDVAASRMTRARCSRRRAARRAASLAPARDDPGQRAGARRRFLLRAEDRRRRGVSALARNRRRGTGRGARGRRKAVQTCRRDVREHRRARPRRWTSS